MPDDPASEANSDTDVTWPHLTAADIEALHRASTFADAGASTPERYPRMTNMSAGFLQPSIVRPVSPAPPEYVTIDLTTATAESDLFKFGAVGRWNMLWEAGQFKRRFFGENELTPDLMAVADRGDHNVIFVPRTPSRYYEYAPLFHLIKGSTLRRFGLPLLRVGQWPFTAMTHDIGTYLPDNFEERLTQAWGATVWRHLIPGSPVGAFTPDDPIRLLAHNLDFWVPPVTEVIQQTLGDFPLIGTIDDSDQLPTEVTLEDGSALHGAVPGWARKGGDIWTGEKMAGWVVEDVIEEADANGRLRDILEAVTGNRVEDDFSNRWSYAKEDFERKLYRKRNKVAVKFVELPDTVPVQGPGTELEIASRLVTSDFMALLAPKERQIVILLSSGYTNLTEIADVMGYANHSPISKKLAKIRRQAITFFDDM